MTRLTMDAVHVRHGKATLVDDLSASVGEGELFGLIGPNGAGKTTAFNLISGTMRPSAGRIWFRDVDITGGPPSRVVALGLASVELPRSARPAAAETGTAALLSQLDAFENTWFPIARRSLESRHPQIAERLFQNIPQSRGAGSALTVMLFLERLAALERGEAPYGADGRGARRLLRERGLSKKKENAARDLLARGDRRIVEGDVHVQPGGDQAVQLKVAERAVDAYGKLASEARTTLVVPSNMTEMSSLIASAMKVVQAQQDK